MQNTVRQQKIRTGSNFNPDEVAKAEPEAHAEKRWGYQNSHPQTRASGVIKGDRKLICGGSSSLRQEVWDMGGSGQASRSMLRKYQAGQAQRPRILDERRTKALAPDRAIGTYRLRGGLGLRGPRESNASVEIRGRMDR